MITSESGYDLKKMMIFEKNSRTGQYHIYIFNIYS